MKRVLPLLSLALGVSLALAGLALVVRSAESAFPGANGKIAFDSNRDGNVDIYVVNPDGLGLTRLTDHPAIDGSPAWSADGSKIAFASDRDGTLDIYSMNADGTDVTRLTADGGPSGSPSWSPDGTKIAFIRSNDIYVLTIGLSPPANITSTSSFPEGAPAWSPDGSKIAFHSDRFDDDFIRPEHPELYVMNADGSGVTGPLATRARDPSWSPDGSQIAFTKLSPIGPDVAGIAAVNADGSGQHLISTSAFDSGPAWSPDGTKIAFSSYRLPLPFGTIPSIGPSILTMDEDGSCVFTVSGAAGFDFNPDWQPVPAPLPTPTPSIIGDVCAVGGFSTDLDVLAPEASLSSSAVFRPGAATLAGVAALLVAAAAALAGAIWFARHRRTDS